MIVEQSYLIPKNAKASVIIMDEVATIMAEYNETRQSLPAENMSAEKLNYFKEMRRWVAIKSQEVEEIQKKVDCETTFFKIYIVLKIISQGLYIAESVTELRKQRNRLRNSNTGIVGSENASTVERAAKSNVTRLVQCAKRSLPALGRIIVPIFMIGIIFIGILALFYPKYVDATVSEKSWEREIEIEEYRTVKENGWSIPSGGRLLYSQSEIRSYETVLDHYETKTRTVTEQVFDGYDTNTYYTDNGNGTFTEHTSQTPRYRTETKLETYEEPVYKQVPVYDTKYYYEIERWVYDRTETSAATDENPYWAEYVLDDNERVSDKKESYDVVFIDDEGKEYTYSCEYGEWTGYELAEEVELKLSAGIVLEVTSKDNIIDVN